MIVTEYSIRDIIAGFPEIQINKNLVTKAKFHWGNEKELNRYIQLKKDDSYPLIWLLPSVDTFNGSRYQNVEKDCSFIIATREVRQNLFNDQRYIKTFDLVLNPLTEYLITGLTKSNITDRVGDDLEISKFPNYSAEDDGEESGTIDLWDAVKLDIRVKFKDNRECLKQVYYG